MKTIIVLYLLAVISTLAGEQEPRGSKTSWSVTTNNNQIVFHMHNDTSGSNWTVSGGTVPISLPHTYRDADSGVVFYVESDGRHVSAIAADGKLLWSRDPFVDAHLAFYRTRTPRIVHFDKIDPTDKDHNWMLRGQTGLRLAIVFNSSQFGTIDAKSGEFTFLGQD
jgi:hypothetical protein